MRLKRISFKEFDDFGAEANPYSIYQTSEYGRTKEKEGLETLFLGLYDGYKIVAATFIYIEPIFGYKYAYAPRGYLIDYNNAFLVKKFSNLLKKFLGNMDVMAIKISPMIIKNKYNSKKEVIYTNPNFNKIFHNFEKLDYYHLGYNNYFESNKPRFEAVIDLSGDYVEVFNMLRKSLKTKIRNASNNGIKIYKGNETNLDSLHFLTKNKYPKPLTYYQDIYRYFDESHNVELYFSKVDTELYLQKQKLLYEKQEKICTLIDTNILENNLNKSKLINMKIIEDNKFNNYKNELITATSLLKDYPEGIITSAILIVKQKDTITLFIDGYDVRYKHFNSKHLLLWKAIEKYSKLGYKYFNLGGVININSSDSKYDGLNEFKLSFNSNVIEYIGDLELITNKTLYFLYRNSAPIRNLLKK